MWPGFDSQTYVACGLSLLVPCSALIGFYQGTLVFLSPQKLMHATIFNNSNNNNYNNNNNNNNIIIIIIIIIINILLLLTFLVLLHIY